VSDYVVKNPKTLEEIKETNTARKYLTLHDLYSDLDLVVSNCVLYNGEAHPLTGIIKKSVNELKDTLNKNSFEIRELEAEIVRSKMVEQKKKEADAEDTRGQMFSSIVRTDSLNLIHENEEDEDDFGLVFDDL
jgi:hypothetical protein